MKKWFRIFILDSGFPRLPPMKNIYDHENFFNTYEEAESAMIKNLKTGPLYLILPVYEVIDNREQFRNG